MARSQRGAAMRPVATNSRVVVVGAGVSGCACAVELAKRGIGVTLMNGALDCVGMPGYGPDVTVDAGRGAWADTFASIPDPLRSAWLNAATAPENGAAFVVVDRRMLSIETKRLLEYVPGLEFRQGLVTDLRIGGEAGKDVCLRDGVTNGAFAGEVERVDQRDSCTGPVAVGTAFGEWLEADAVVVAVGLGLGGRVRAGESVLPGGRYGETPADGLWTALERLGVTFRESAIEVGPRFAAASAQGRLAGAERGGRAESLGAQVAHGAKVEDDGRGRGAAVRNGFAAGGEALARCQPQVLRPLREVLRGLDPAEAGGEPSHRQWGSLPGAQWMVEVARGWPAEYPPSPHWTTGADSGGGAVCWVGDGETVAEVCPDGAATGEIYTHTERREASASRAMGVGDEIDPCLEGVEARSSRVSADPPATRLQHRVSGLMVTSRDSEGRVEIQGGGSPRIWVAGRAGGATSYLESVMSGVRVAENVERALACARAEDDEGGSAFAPSGGSPPTGSRSRCCGSDVHEEEK